MSSNPVTAISCGTLLRNAQARQQVIFANDNIRPCLTRQVLQMGEQASVTFGLGITRHKHDGRSGGPGIRLAPNLKKCFLAHQSGGFHVGPRQVRFLHASAANMSRDKPVAWSECLQIYNLMRPNAKGGSVPGLYEDHMSVITSHLAHTPARLSFALNVVLFIALALSLLPGETNAALARPCVETSPLVNSVVLAQSGKIRPDAGGSVIQLPASAGYRSTRLKSTSLAGRQVSFIRCVPRHASLGG